MDWLAHLDVRRWWIDDLFRRLLKHGRMLAMGNAVAGAAGLLSSALTARALGAELFGVLVMVKSFISTVENLVSFQTGSGLIKYGAEALEQGRQDELKRVLKFSFLLDVAAGAAGAALTAISAGLVGRWLGWEPATIRIAMFYGSIMVLTSAGMPSATLRLFRRFDLSAVQTAIAAGVKLAFVAAAVALHGGLVALVIAWWLAELVDRLMLQAMAWALLRQRGLGSLWRSSARGLSRACPGIWSFVWATNLSSSIRLVSRELDLLIVGGTLGSASAGLYKVAKQCSQLVSHLHDPLNGAIYPELARLWAAADLKKFRRLALRAGLAAGLGAMAIWIGFALFGRPVLGLVFGAPFVQAQPVLLWHTLGAVILAFGFPLTAAMLAMGQPQKSLGIYLVCTLAYFPAMLVLVRAWGLIGAGVAYMLYQGARSVLMAAWSWSMLRAPHNMPTRPRRAEPRAQPA